MFDKAYFDQHLRRQFEQLGNARAIVTLHNGREFHIREIDQAHEGYVLLVVFPDEGVTDQTRQQRRKYGGEDVVWDRVAIDYGSISHVWLSVTEPERDKQLGFRVRPA